MALSKPSVVSVLTKEDTNFLRLAHLVIRISPTAVRTLFDNHFNPAGLQSSLNQIKGKLESLCQKRVINQVQLDLLFPTNGSCVTSSDMDVTLMLALIRNCTKIKIKDTLPPPTDVSEGDDLSRIKHYRNLIAHSVDGRINDTEFHSAWKEVSEALQRIGGVSFKDKCDALFIAELDNSYRNVYLDFVQAQTRLQEIEDDVKQLKLQQNDPVPSNIREQMLDEITTWMSDEVKYFPTSAAKAIFSLVQKISFVIITGSPGMGKTSTARHIALVLKNTADFDILPVQHPQDIINYCKKGYRQIFILDDMCGKFTADQNIIFEWDRHRDTLRKLFERNPKSLRVIGTCRLQIVEDENFRRLSERFGITECNLLSEELMLSTNEKRKIASKHFDVEVVEELDDDTVNLFDMFPLLCSLFAKSDDKATFGIFYNPFKELEREFDEIHYNNEGCFVGLALLVIHNNNLNKDIFKERTNQKLCKIFDDMFEMFRMTKRPVKHHVKAMLQTINKTYVTESDTNFRAVHDKIFDMISFYFGKKMIEIILEYGDSSFIMERMELETLNLPHDEFKIMIPPNTEDLYFRRILQDIADRKLCHVLCSLQLQHETCERKLLTYLLQNPNISSVLIHNQWSYVLSEMFGLNMILEYLINQLDAKTVLEECLDKSYYEGGEELTNEPMLVAISEGLYTSGLILLQHGVDSNSVCCVKDHEGTLLQLACKLCRNDFVSMLIEHKCDVNLFHEGFAPIHIACVAEYLDIVDNLLKANCNVNIKCNDGKTPLLIACKAENINIVTMLLHSNCNVNVSDVDGQTPLHIACSLGFEDGVKLLLATCCYVDTCDKKLLKRNCNINIKDNYGKTPLLIACETKNINIVTMLLQSNCNVNVSDEDGQTPLHIACSLGFEDGVKLLLSTGCDVDNCSDKKLLKSNCDVNIQDEEEKTPLLIACETGNINIVIDLLSSNCNLNLPNMQGQTPLHVSCLMGFEDVVKILLSTCFHSEYFDVEKQPTAYCDVNSQDNDEKTPLFIACETGNINIVVELLSSNCNLNLANVQGLTPLHVSCLLGFEDVVKILLSTCFHSEHFDVEKHLTTYCDVNSQDNDEKTPLFIACETGNTSIARELLIANCNQNITNAEGQTPLHVSCIKGFEDIVHILLSHHCNIDKRDTNGNTALAICCFCGHFSIAKLLIENCCDFNIVDSEGTSPLEIAINAGHSDIVNLLISTSEQIFPSKKESNS